MRKIIFALTLAVTAITTGLAQTLNVVTGNVTTQFPAEQAGDMTYTDNGTLLTICGKTFTVSDIDQIYIDEQAVIDDSVSISYNGTEAAIVVAGNVAKYLTIVSSGAHVSITQDDDVEQEINYTLTGTTDDGEFYMTGSYKATVNLAGLVLTNTTPIYSGAALCIMNSKRINLSVKKGTENTLTDCATGSQKAAIYCKGHLELKGQGTLNVYGKLAHAIKSGEYMQMRKCTVNILEAVKDGLSCDEYFLMESGILNVSGTGDDAIQCDIDGTTTTGETEDHEDEDSGNIYILDGTVTLNITANAAKGMKAGGNLNVMGSKIDITQTGSIVASDDLSYPTSMKSTGDINISGGTVTINNTADGGKGMSADGAINIDESSATTVIDIIANGKGGTAELTGTETGDPEEETKSYKVYVSLPVASQGGQGGQGNPWTTLYLYKEDGTQVQQLTSTVTKSSGSSSATFYVYDFQNAGDGSTSYYFKSDDYTSRGGRSTYTIKSTTFTAPTSGSDIYYSISNSYQTSGTTRTYSLTNVTNTYSGSSDVSEEEGTSYNAIGIKADSNLTVKGGTVTVKNTGAMSKSMKSKGTLTIDGGDITLTPSGAMQVINNDASYCSGIKTDDFIQNGGTLTINASGTAGKGISATNITTNGGTLSIKNTGGGQTGTNDNYTAKGMKADKDMALNGGAITITMSGAGGKGIKVNGNYTQGIKDNGGPTLKVTTTGSRFGSTSGGGGWGGWGPGGMGQSSSGGSAKAVKVMGLVTIYDGETEIYTSTDGAEGLESKYAINIEGGKHYFKCYDDCINCSKKTTGATGKIIFNGGVTVCYSTGNDAIDSNAGTTGAITIGNGAVMAYTTKGSPEEGFDCDNNSYIQITGNGYGISAGGTQGGGGWGGTSSTISNANQGYALLSSTVSYKANTVYTLSDDNGNNLVTFSFPAAISSTLSLITAKGMVKGSTYYVKYVKNAASTTPTDATTAWHGLYLGSSHQGDTDLISTTKSSSSSSTSGFVSQ